MYILTYMYVYCTYLLQGIRQVLFYTNLHLVAILTYMYVYCTYLLQGIRQVLFYTNLHLVANVHVVLICIH